MKLRATLAGLVLAIGMAISGGTAQAATVDFAVDGAGSSASVTGCLCLGNLSATTAAGLGGTAFSLMEGESATFDFMELFVSSTFFGSAGGAYAVEATLAFADPSGSVSSNGSGVFASLLGFVSGGSLTWNDAVQQVSFGNGGQFTVALQQGFAIVPGSSATVSATVTLDAAPVPLPAAGWMLLAGVGGLIALRRRALA